ncbi:MAG: hypothetical protein D6696_14550 [Acidobacteria bacterium]|nr:MAG: hypothetical protein D6696_14550 [Acidobacteriota bacterium]
MSRRPGLILLVGFAVLVRLYYFWLTKDQPLWWDEAEYALAAKSLVFGTPSTGWWEGGPILLPLLLAAFYALGLGVGACRLLLLLVSVATVVLVYAIGRRVGSERTGLIAAFFFSLDYLNLFYSMRIMTEVFQLAFGLLAIHLFLRRRHEWAIVPLIVAGTLFRFTTALVAVILVAHLALVDGPAFLKRRSYRLSAALGALAAAPYLAWSWWRFGDPLHPFKAGSAHLTVDLGFGSGLQLLAAYLAALPAHLHAVLWAAFLFEVLFFYDVLWGFDAVARGEDRPAAHRFLLLLWILAIFLFHGFAVNLHVDRYVVLAFPAIFIVVALGLERLHDAIARSQRYQRRLPAIFLAAVLVAGGIQLGQDADAEIRTKRRSFESLREAAEWIAEHSAPEDAVMTMSVPQMTYYAERRSYAVPDSEAAFAAALAELRPKYVVMSVFEQHPQWTFEVEPETHGLRPVRYVPPDEPLLVVYEVER